MSNFFGNLIGRHQEQGSNGDAKPIVEPRPRARYEVEPDVPNEPESDQQYFLAVNTSAGEELSRSPESAVPLNNRGLKLPVQSNASGITDATETSRSERTNEMDISEQIKDLTALPPSGGLLKDSPVPDWNNKDGQKPGLQVEQLRIDGDAPSKGRLSTDDLDSRIQSILHRLRPSENRHESAVGANPSDRQAMLSTNPDTLNPTQSKHSDLSPEEKIDESPFNLNGNNSMQEAPGEASSEKANPEGLLNIPDWLAGMQSDINKRWQHLNTKIDSAKPVVNVTIGRVEVRAVQEPGLKTAEVQKKPSGVMSLNDYLKSRDKEGRA